MWPVLTPVTQGAIRSSSLIVVDPPPRLDAAQDGAARVGDLGEGGDPQQVLGQRRQVAGAGVVAALVEADRVGVVGVGQPQRRRVAVHLGDEARLRTGGSAGEVVGGVVAAAQDQAVEQVPHADPLPRPQAEQRLAVFGLVGSGADDAVERQLVQGDVGGHQLRRAGDRQVLLAGVGDQHFAAASVDQRPGARLDRRSLGERTRRHASDETAAAVPPRHARAPNGAGVSPQLQLLARDQDLRVDFGVERFDAVRPVTPLWWAIEIRVSPLLTS